jgi:hypothetical protein
MDESIDAGLSRRSWDADSPALIAGVVRAEHLANLLDRTSMSRSRPIVLATSSCSADSGGTR